MEESEGEAGGGVGDVLCEPQPQLGQTEHHQRSAEEQRVAHRQACRGGVQRYSTVVPSMSSAQMEGKKEMYIEIPAKIVPHLSGVPRTTPWPPA